ncbi:hypothetical protein FRX31_026740 [Thalictrum thalictroides]|uniref:Uncharacterized protein n=1 Tax=Thalictrum thalictroides TaxID=46969 RepID=A0A7J6VFK9_THATH|nr:hypothetical protein FRX31_026740 [Thalictrum thalictroides]
MATCRARNEAEEKKTGKKSEVMVVPDDMMPPSSVPKVTISSKKRSRSGVVKIGPEPQLVISSSSSKDVPTSEARSTPKTSSGRGSKGKEIALPFAPTSVVYMFGEKEKAQVMSSDSAFKNPLVARALNEGIVLEVDAAVVQKQSLSKLFSHMNSCIAVVKHKDKELAEMELLKENLAKERAKRVENHNAWKLHCDELTTQLNAIGTPEEDETQVDGDHEPSTPQDFTLGPFTEQEGEQLQIE